MSSYPIKPILLTILLLLNAVLLGFSQDKAEWENKLAESLKSKDYISSAEACYKLAVYYDNQDSVHKSIMMAREALKHADTAKSDRWKALSLNFLASVYSASGTADSINKMFEKSISLLLEIGDTARAAGVLLNLGMEYVNAGAYEKALELKLKALDYKVIGADSSNIAFYYQQIGEVYSALKIADKWKYYLERARELSKNPKYARLYTTISILNDLGGIYTSENNFQAALSTYQEMINLSIANNYPKGVATANANLVEVYLALNDPEQALKAAQKSYQMAGETNAYRLISAANNLAMCYLKLNQPEKALKYFVEVITHPSITDYSDEYLSAVRGISKTYAALGNYKEAFHFKELYSKHYDSLNNLEVKKNITLLETQYRTKENEQQIKLLSAENELQSAQLNRTRVMIIGVVAVFLLLAVIALLLFRQHRLSQRNRQIALEQKLLRSQMNPHFIFNALSAIQQYLVSGDNSLAAEYLGRFASLMRAVLKSSREEWITLNEEIEMIRSYLEVQKIRFQNHLQFNLNVGEDIESDIILVPPLLMQPFIENAIEHGIRRSENGGSLSITIRETDTHLLFEIEDDGPGFGSSSGKEGHISYATNIFKERVQLLNKRLLDSITYVITDKCKADPQMHGVLIQIHLPIVTKSGL